MVLVDAARSSRAAWAVVSGLIWALVSFNFARSTWADVTISATAIGAGAVADGALVEGELVCPKVGSSPTAKRNKAANQARSVVVNMIRGPRNL